MYDRDYNLRQIHDALVQRRNFLKMTNTKASPEDQKWAMRLLDMYDRISGGEEIEVDKPMSEPCRPDPNGGRSKAITTNPATSRSYRGMFYPNEAHPLSDDGWRSKSEFLQAVFMGRYDSRFNMRTMNEAVGTTGGIIIPQQYSAQLMDEALKMEIFRPLCKVYPMTSADLYVGAWDDLDLSSGDVSGFSLEWLHESSQGTERTGKLRSLHLQAKTGAIYANVTLEMFQDAPAFEQELTSILARALARGIDKAIIRGTDAAGPSSILNSSALVTASKETGQSATTIVYENIAAMYGRQLDHDGAVWLANHNCLPQLLTLGKAVGTGGSSVDVLSEKDGTYHLLGKRIILTDLCSTLGTKGDIFYLNPNYYAVGLREEMTVHSTDAYKWLEREHSFRIVVRMDGSPTIAKAVVPEHGSSLSPFVALETRS